jgi:serine/threonine protein kinase
MGVIYLARVEGAAGFSRPVAVKRVVPDRAEDASTLRLFVREARILAQLNHPNIVNVIDFGEEQGDYVMVLEYVRGYNLGAWHRYLIDSDRRLPVDLCVYIMASVLDALEYAHTFKRADGTPTPVIHRDVSPTNVLLDVRGTVKLLDFGIARIEGAGEYRTQDGTLKGKFPFTAPEVFSGDEPTDQSDVYSAGVLLYMMLTNVNPFRGTDAKATIARVLTHDAQPPSALNPDLPPILDDILARALAKNPEERFASAAEFAAELRALTTRPPSDVRNELAQVLEEDFTGAMPERLGLIRLETLDEAAAEAYESVDYEVLEAEMTHTVIDPMRPQSSGPPPSSPKSAAGSSWRWIVMAGIGLGALGIIAWFAVRFEPARVEPPQVIVIQKESAPAAVGTPGPEQSAPEPPGDTKVDPARTDDESGRGGASAEGVPEGSGPRPRLQPKGTGTATDRLTAVFRGRQPQIEACFTRHADDIEGAPRITLHFDVDTTGKVTGARLTPGALSGTALGTCLLGVARSTPFDRRAEPISFSIPITARRTQ